MEKEDEVRMIIENYDPSLQRGLMNGIKTYNELYCQATQYSTPHVQMA